MLYVRREGVLRPATSSEAFTAKLRKCDASHYRSLVKAFENQIKKAQYELSEIAKTCPHYWEVDEGGTVLPGTKCDVCGAEYSILNGSK